MVGSIISNQYIFLNNSFIRYVSFVSLLHSYMSCIYIHILIIIFVDVYTYDKFVDFMFKFFNSHLLKTLNMNKLLPVIIYFIIFYLSAFQNFGNLIKTPGCRIPEMYVNGPTIDKYMNFDEKLLNCKSNWNYTLSLVTSNLTSLTLNITVLTTLNITVGNPTFKCHYSPVKKLAPNYKNLKEYNENNLQ